MSHFTTIKTSFRDKDMLLRCLREMGHRVEEEATIRGYQGDHKVDVAVRMSNGYDIGFSRQPDGSYGLVADWWGVHGTTQDAFLKNTRERVQQLEEKIRREVEEMQKRLRHEYAVSTSLKTLKQQGFQVVQHSTEADGTVRILARRWR